MEPEEIDKFDAYSFSLHSDIVLEEATLRIINPLRKFKNHFFPDKKRIQVQESLEKMREFGSLVLKIYRDKQQRLTQDDEIEDKSIIGHLARFDYASEEHRISDVIVFMIAGYETTAVLLFFLLYDFNLIL